jgi:hypothetical protein
MKAATTILCDSDHKQCNFKPMKEDEDEDEDEDELHHSRW